MTKKEQLRKDFEEIIEDHVSWIDINGRKHNGCIDESDIKVIVDKLLYKANEYCK